MNRPPHIHIKIVRKPPFMHRTVRVPQTFLVAYGLAMLALMIAIIF